MNLNQIICCYLVHLNGGYIINKKNEQNFNKISVTYEQLKLFLEKYGYKTNDIIQLQKIGIDTINIKHDINLK